MLQNMIRKGKKHGCVVAYDGMDGNVQLLLLQGREYSLQRRKYIRYGAVLGGNAAMNRDLETVLPNKLCRL